MNYIFTFIILLLINFLTVFILGSTETNFLVIPIIFALDSTIIIYNIRDFIIQCIRKNFDISLIENSPYKKEEKK